MFDENKNNEFDILMKSVLSQAEEEVPSRVWEGISSELDRIETAKVRRPVVLWFRRSVVTVAAAAAVTVGVFVDWNGHDTDLVPQSTDAQMIAVVEPQEVEEDMTSVYVADAREEVRKAVSTVTEIPDEPMLVEQEQEQEQPAAVEVTAEPQKAMTAEPEVTTGGEAWEEDWKDWEDDHEPARKNETSFVVSGIAGTNNVQKNGGGPMRRPTLSTSRPQTGVEQKSTESTYGLPVSFGAGARFGISERWSLGIGANYTILTRRFFGTYTKVDGTGTVETSVSSDIRNVQQYIGIPVNAFYNIVNKDYMNFYAYAGGTVEKCISDKYDILNTEYLYKGTVKGVQLSANLGIGVEFLLGKHLGIYVDPSLRYYFDCGQPKSVRTAQPFMMGLEMGLRFRL